MTTGDATLYFDDVREGDELPPFAVNNVTRTDLVRYAGASGDFNPIHHDQTFAEKAGLPTVFAHGMLTAGFLSKCVTDYVGRQNLRRFRIEDNDRRYIDGDVVALNQNNETAIQGSFTAELPPRP
jgi:acyl dehydratase